ncbi:MAG: DUF4199 domain-containing protein [Saprospiraceae bacterium]|nr:DUF4199 domain-containing protein [Saprospiraceae bacterium]
MYIKTALKSGLCLGIAQVVGTQILTWMGLGTSNWFPILMNILVIVFITLMLKQIKKAQGGKLKFLKALLHIVIAIVLAFYIFQLYMFIYINYIDPQWVENTASSWSQTMADNGVEQVDIDKRIDFFKNSYKPLSMFTIQVLNYGVPQIVVGAIVSLFFVLGKKKNS